MRLLRKHSVARLGFFLFHKKQCFRDVTLTHVQSVGHDTYPGVGLKKSKNREHGDTILLVDTAYFINKQIS